MVRVRRHFVDGATRRGWALFRGPREGSDLSNWVLQSRFWLQHGQESAGVMISAVMMVRIGDRPEVGG